ncbi:hypothetical protein [Paenibacillus sp. IITD108]|uniref:hypothetical protein n=1 Tax=Paenibacillus sp. IITD108 TaxID=3116649 RepID=UPI002F40BD13
MDYERERANTVNSHVTKRQMTEEERERIFGSIKPYTDQNGIERQPGVRQRMEEALYERRKRKKKS